MGRWGGSRTAGWTWLVAVLSLSFLLAACSGSSNHQTGSATRPPDLVIATPTAAQVASASATPALTPTPTATPSATPSPTPSATPSPTPSATPEPTEAPAPPRETLADGTHGYAVTSSASIYAQPTTQSAPVRRLAYEEQLNLHAKVRGENVVVGAQTWYIAAQDWQNLWYQVDGGYVYSAFVWVPRQGEVLPSQLPRGERWVAVDLGTQTAKLMIGDSAVYSADVTTGKDGYETPTGHWRVNYQVLNETMTSGQAGINDPAEHYDVKNVLFTQYFDGLGDALHLNYWQPAGAFGNTRTSHGCVGLYVRDAQYFWMFGQPGMRVEITQNGRILPPPVQPTHVATVAPTAPPPTPTPAPAPRRTPAATRASAATPTPTPAIAVTPVLIAPTPTPQRDEDVLRPATPRPAPTLIITPPTGAASPRTGAGTAATPAVPHTPTAVPQQGQPNVVLTTTAPPAGR